MRQPLSATPAVSHVISRQFEPTPALTCREDWRNLTSNTSIQILSLEASECHEDSLFYPDDISNQLRFVDTIISPRQEGICSSQYASDNPDISSECVAETLVSLDSLIHHHGDTLDARIIFTPKEQRTDRRKRRMETTYIPVKQSIEPINCKQQMPGNCNQRLNRNCYSDSDLESLVKLCQENKNRQATVARSKSLSYAEYIKRNNEPVLVNPLLPCTYKSKIGGVKRIPSFRNTAKPVDGHQKVRTYVKPVSVYKPQTVWETQTVINKVDIATKSEERKSINTSDGNGKPAYRVGLQKSKIAKLVKNGLKSVIRANDNRADKCTSEGMENKSTFERRHYRKVRNRTDIGGLSEFLRRNERRKTVDVVIEADKTEKIEDFAFDELAKVNNHTVSSLNSADVNETESCFTSDEETETPRPILGCRRLHSTGTSNLKFNHCQRKLFQSYRSSPKADIEFDPFSYAETYISSETGNDSQPRRGPRLGMLGSIKPVNVLPIDELEMDLVHDLKRRVERAVRCSKIKTNGSLKMKPKVQQVDRSMAPSPRRCQRYGPTTFSHGMRRVQVKRESIV